MAQRITVHLDDDLDGSTAVGTFTFGLEGDTYEIDLSESNAQRLRDAMTEFINAARRTTKGKRVTAPAKAAKARPSNDKKVDPKAVRVWAKEQGIDLPARGRVSNDLIEQYEAAVA